MTYDPDGSTDPYIAEEVKACQLMRPTAVVIGQHVQYRHDHHGDVTDALVLDVDHDYPTKGLIDGLMVPLPPWPTLLLDTLYGQVKTREARARGSAGWLPVGWHERGVHAPAKSKLVRVGA